MLEIQLVQRSQRGVIIPVGRSDDETLVQYVARKILDEMRDWRFEDDLLNEFARREEKALIDILVREGINNEN